MARRGPITVLVKKLLILIDLKPRFTNKGDIFRIVVLDVADTIDLYNLEVSIGRGGFICVTSRGSTPFIAA